MARLVHWPCSLLVPHLPELGEQPIGLVFEVLAEGTKRLLGGGEFHAPKTDEGVSSCRA
jgi:hypothetical protein